MANHKRTITVFFMKADGQAGWANVTFNWSTTHYPNRDTAQRLLVRQLVGRADTFVRKTPIGINIYFDITKLGDGAVPTCAGLPAPVLMIAVDMYGNFLSLGKQKVQFCYWIANHENLGQAMQEYLQQQADAQEEVEQQVEAFLEEHEESEPPEELQPPEN